MDKVEERGVEKVEREICVGQGEREGWRRSRRQRWTRPRVRSWKRSRRVRWRI